MNKKELLQEKLLSLSNKSNQVICAIEEMSELIKVLTKYLRNSPKFSEEDLIEETAHVLLTVELIQKIFFISDKDILKEQLIALQKFI